MMNDAQERPPAAPQDPVGWARLVSMCVGLFGVQIVWSLHGVNTSRVFQSFGARLDELPLLWIAAPVTGLLVQPLVGYASDRTWGRLGRRRPYMLGGAILTAVALAAMPMMNSLIAASLMLWLLIAALNIVAEPFRVLVADAVPPRQVDRAFAVQLFFIGSGAVFASVLPLLLQRCFGVVGAAATVALPASVALAYQVGAVLLLLTVGWTVIATREPPPSSSSQIPSTDTPRDPDAGRIDPDALFRRGRWWLAAGIGLIAGATSLADSRDLYTLAGFVAVYGGLQFLAGSRMRRGKAAGLLAIVTDLATLPLVMRRIAVVQFFVWFGLFAMWVYMVPALAGASGDATSAGYDLAANRAGVIFAGYNGVAAVSALLMPRFSLWIGRRALLSMSLLCGAAGLAALAFIGNGGLFWIPAIGIGFAWAAIISLPYAMLADTLPAAKRGVYMGIHNIFLVVPQLVAATLLGPIVAGPLSGGAAPVMLMAAAAFLLGGAAALRIPKSNCDNRRA